MIRTAILLFLGASIFAHAQLENMLFGGNQYLQGKNSSAQIIYTLGEAAKMIQEDPGHAFKQFQDASDSEWNRSSFGLYVVDVNTGEILVHPQDSNVSGYRMQVDDINAKPFAHSSMIKTMRASTEDYVRNIHVEHDPDDLGYGDFYIMTLPEGKPDAEYVLCAAQRNWQMERMMVRRLVEDATSLIELKGEKAFPSLTENEWLFDYKLSHVFVLNRDGSIAFDPIYKYNKDTHLTNDQRSFIDGLISGVLNNPKGYWYFDSWPADKSEDGDTRPKWYFASIASYRGKEYIVGTSAHAVNDEEAEALADSGQ